MECVVLSPSIVGDLFTLNSTWPALSTLLPATMRASPRSSTPFNIFMWTTFGRWRFPKNVEETREHYFGENPSYLIYECLTPSGIQTLLVRGLGNMRSWRIRAVRLFWAVLPRRLRGGRSEDSRIRFHPESCSPIGISLEVPRVHLWEVLTGQIPAKAKNLPSLGILPLRSQQEYNSFREVFVKLLALTDATARDLKRLIIACHAHEVGEARIDVAATYKDMFERAVRSEEEYRFIQEVDAHISQGRGLRDDIAAAQQLLREQTPQYPAIPHCREASWCSTKRSWTTSGRS